MKKKLLLITNGFPFGESERSFLTEEARRLAQAFHLIVLAPQNKEPLLYPADGIRRIERYQFTPFHAAKDIRAIANAAHPEVLKEFFCRAKSRRFKTVVTDYRETVSYFHHAWEMAQQICALVKEEQIEVIYTYWCLEGTLAALLVRRRCPQVRVVTRFHGYDLYNERRKTGWQPFRRLIAKECERLVFACEAGREYFLSVWGQKWKEKSVVSYIGCRPLGRIPFQQAERLTLVSCSNAIPLKRVHLIIEALALLPEDIKVDWHHIGGGTELELLKEQALTALSACENIRWEFHGSVPNQRLEALYQQLQPRLFITTTETEGGAPVSVQEIFSAGVPAVGTAVGGIPELVLDGETGYLLPENPLPAEIAEAIRRFFDLPAEQKQAMGDAAYALWQEKLDAAKNAERLVSQLETLAR